MLYPVVPGTQNILSKLVENVSNSKKFKNHISALQASPKQVNNRKAVRIQNTIQSIRVFNTKLKPLFLAKDIGILLGISHIKILTKKFEIEEKLVGYIMDKNKKKEVIFLTKLGVYRCFYSGRSALARLFRNFIGSLLDHMLTHESELLSSISAQFRKDNPGLVEMGMEDLYSKVITLEQKYLDEQKKSLLLELECEDERKKRKDADCERVSSDIANSFSLMHIEQLKKEKDNCIKQIKDMDIEHEQVANDSELNQLKQKYMKPMYIYLLSPAYLKKVITAKKIEINKTEVDKTSPENLRLCEILQEMPMYMQNFANIFSDKTGSVDDDEILYYSVGFSKNVSKSKNLMCASKVWVANKQHYCKIIEELSECCDKINIKQPLFKTTIEEINDISKYQFVNI